MRALGVATCALLVLSGSSALGAGRGAILSIADRDPLTIRGARFAPGEHVKLFVTGQGLIVRSVRAGPRGGFTTMFRVRLGRCDAVVIQAIGDRGHRAQVDITQTACTPPP
jgi:hypothetical protein